MAIVRILIVLAALFSPASARAVEIVSHRGNACGYTENSIEAIHRSWVLGVDAIEVDVRVSTDDIVFLYHDDLVEDQPVKDMKYTDLVEIVGLKASPTLQSVLESVEPKGQYILDLKPPWINDYNHLVDIVRDNNIDPSLLVFQSDNVDLLKLIREELPTSKYLYLSDLKRKLPFFMAPSPNQILKEVIQHNLDGVSLKGRKFITKKFVNEFRSLELTVFIWTINNLDRAKFYTEISVDGIITDSSEKFVQAFSDERFNGQGCN